MIRTPLCLGNNRFFFPPLGPLAQKAEQQQPAGADELRRTPRTTAAAGDGSATAAAAAFARARHWVPGRSMGGPLPGIAGLASQELQRHGVSPDSSGEARDPHGARVWRRLRLRSPRAQDLRRWPHRQMEPDAAVKWPAGNGQSKLTMSS